MLEQAGEGAEAGAGGGTVASRATRAVLKANKNL